MYYDDYDYGYESSTNQWEPYDDIYSQQQRLAPGTVRNFVGRFAYVQIRGTRREQLVYVDSVNRFGDVTLASCTTRRVFQVSSRDIITIRPA